MHFQLSLALISTKKILHIFWKYWIYNNWIFLEIMTSKRYKLSFTQSHTFSFLSLTHAHKHTIPNMCCQFPSNQHWTLCLHLFWTLTLWLYLNLNWKLICSLLPIVDCNLVFCQRLWSYSTTALHKFIYYYYYYLLQSVLKIK